MNNKTQNFLLNLVQYFESKAYLNHEEETLLETARELLREANNEM